MGKYSTKAVRNGFVITIEEEDYETFENLIDLLAKESAVIPYLYSQNMYVDQSMAQEVGMELDTQVVATQSVVSQPGLNMGDGTNHLGEKLKKAKATTVKVNDSYLIGASSYSYDAPVYAKDSNEIAKPAEIRFYNKHSKYPACTNNFAGKGEQYFREVFGDWEPEVGSKLPMPEPVYLYIVCSGNTDQNNPYQNLRGKKAVK